MTEVSALCLKFINTEQMYKRNPYFVSIFSIYTHIKMKSIFAAVFAVAVAVVSAQSNPVSITSPLTGTIYTAGQTAIISW